MRVTVVLLSALLLVVGSGFGSGSGSGFGFVFGVGRGRTSVLLSRMSIMESEGNLVCWGM